MRRDAISAELPERIACSGTLTSGDKSVAGASLVIERKKYDAVGAWSFTLHVAEKDQEQLREIADEPDDNEVKFRGKTDTDMAISANGILWTYQHRAVLQGTIEELRYGFEEPDRKPSQQFITITLSPTALALPEFDPLTKGRLADGENPAEWTIRNVGLGGTDAILARRFELSTGQVGGHLSTHRIGVPTLSIALTHDECRSDVLTLTRDIDSSVTELLLLLSFLDRRFVHWTEMKVLSIWDEPKLIQESLWERAIWLPTRSETREGLLSPRRMSGDALSRLLATYQTLPFKDAVSTAVKFLTGSRDVSHLEAKLTNAITALESLVSGIAESEKTAQTIPRGKFERLRTKLCEAIRDFALVNDVDESARTEIEAKLPELRRRPIISQVTALTEKWGVEYGDIWPGISLGAGLTSAFRQRNELLHAGRVGSPRELIAATMRVRALTERLIYRMLEGDNQWIRPRIYRDLLLLPAATDGTEPK